MVVLITVKEGEVQVLSPVVVQGLRVKGGSSVRHRKIGNKCILVDKTHTKVQ